MAEEGDPKSILRLPDDCLLHIFTHLQDVHDIVALRIVSLPSHDSSLITSCLNKPIV